jgi:tRNA(adenine34) deaminase
VNYELFMEEALAEARLALNEGEPPCAAVAVVDEAMVARARDRVRETGDPTAHAVMGAIREAARRLGRERLADVTIFTTIEPCSMCVGALLQADIETLVFAAPDLENGAVGGAVQLAQSAGLPRRLRVVSGIRREEVEELRSRVVVRAASNGRSTAS